MQQTDLERRSGLPAGRRASPLRYGDYRILCLSTVFQGVGFMGETVVLGWLLLDLTDSAFIVGLGIALRALPNFLLGIPGGAIADRVDRRSLLRAASFGSASNAAVLAGLALSGALTVPAILLFTFTGGGLRALGQTARQSYAFDVAGPSLAVSSMAFLRLAQGIGGIAGSLGAGLVLEAAGAGEAYFAMMVCLLLSALALLLLRTPGQAAPLQRTPVLQGTREYVSEMGRNHTLATLVGFTALAEVLGFSHQAALANLSRDLLDVGPEGLGLLSAAGAVGGVVAVALTSLRGEPARKGRMFLVVLMLFGASLIVLGNGSSLAVAVLAIACVSGMAGLTDVLSQSLVQSAVPNELRGRAMGSWILAIGFGPIGHVQVGALIALLGVTAALTINGALLVALAALTALRGGRIKAL